MSGITYNNSRGNGLRFLTLTTSKGAKRDIQQDFRVLKMRIKRLYGTFEYIRIRTNEGNGVLHILFIGGFIPQTWISRNWEEIHQSPVVDIRAASRIKGLGRYIVSQYLSDQRCSFLRYSWSWKWVYFGFVKVWRKICISCKNPIAIWNLHLKGYQVYIDGKVLKPPPDIGLVTLEQVTLDLVNFQTYKHFPSKIPVYFAQFFNKCDWLSHKKH